MERYACVTLRQRPEWMEQAAAWFHDKWGVPKQAYLQCMKAYLHGDTEYGWYLCLDGEKMTGALASSKMIFIPEGIWRPISARSIRKRNTAAEESRDVC